MCRYLLERAPAARCCERGASPWGSLLGIKVVKNGASFGEVEPAPSISGTTHWGRRGGIVNLTFFWTVPTWITNPSSGCLQQV